MADDDRHLLGTLGAIDSAMARTSSGSSWPIMRFIGAMRTLRLGGS